MVYYICERCGYKTHHKSVFRKHLHRKRICMAVLIDIPIDVLREAFQNNTYKRIVKTECEADLVAKGAFTPSDDVSSKSMSLVKIDEDIGCIEDIIDDDCKYTIEEPEDEIESVCVKPISAIEESTGIYICSYCDAQFTRRYNCTRHQNKCKRKTDKIDELQEKIDKLGKLLEKSTTTHIVGNNNTIIDKQQNNIIINNYKSENTEYITNRVLEKILTMGPVKAVPRLLKYLHFNKKHPENHNLAITDVGSEFAHIRTNNMWQVRILNELLEELVSSKFNILDEYFETEGRDKIPSHKANSYEMYREKISEDKTIRDQLKNKLYETIINFSKELGIVENI